MVKRIRIKDTRRGSAALKTGYLADIVDNLRLLEGVRRFTLTVECTFWKISWDLKENSFSYGIISIEP
jgi:hypothetical protein